MGPGCYIPLGVRKFPIRQKIDDNGDGVVEEEDKTRFMCDRAGGHLKGVVINDPLPMQDVPCEEHDGKESLGRQTKQH